MLRFIGSPLVPPPAGTYSPGIAWGGLVFLSGQGPFDTAGNLVGATFEEQLRRTFENLETVARSAGTSLTRAVRLGVHLQYLDDFAVLNELSKDYLSEPYPARTTVQADLNGFLIEVDAIVALSAE